MPIGRVLLLLGALVATGCSSLRTSEFTSSLDKRLRSPAYANRSVYTGAGHLSWPVKPKKTYISRGFKGGGDPHHGVDIVGRHGTPILAAHAGHVIYVGSAYRGYGNIVIVDNGRGWSSFYAHLSKVFVKEGMKVSRGEVIAAMGNTGRTTGTHLHFELRRAKVPVDPIEYLP